MKKIIVIIVTYNGVKWIQKCLDTVKQSSLEVTIIIVDNNSTDNTIEFVQEFEDIIIIKQKKNLGFGQANNIGILHALKMGADYCFLMNQDVYLFPDTIENLIKAGQQFSNHAILSPIHLNGSGDLLDLNFSLYVSPKKNKRFFSDAVMGSMAPVYDFSFINAAAWLLPVKKLNQIGGFDPMFFHYQEDNNYCQRVLYHGYQIGVVTTAFMCHDRMTDKNRPEIFSKEYYQNYCNQLKVKYGNINNPLPKKARSFEKRRQLHSIFKGLLLFNFKAVLGHIKQYRLIHSAFKQIEFSRSNNVLKGGTYLK